MNILIIKKNEAIVKGFYPEAIFTECTKNTCSFKISKNKFNKLYEEVKKAGFNPYALFSW